MADHITDLVHGYHQTFRDNGNALPVTLAHDSAELTSAAVSCSSAGDNALVAGVAAQTIRVYRLLLNFSATDTATLKNGSTSLTGALPVYAGTVLSMDGGSEPLFTCTAAAAFNLTLGIGTSVTGAIWYTQE